MLVLKAGSKTSVVGLVEDLNFNFLIVMPSFFNSLTNSDATSASTGSLVVDSDGVIRTFVFNVSRSENQVGRYSRGTIQSINQSNSMK